MTAAPVQHTVTPTEARCELSRVLASPDFASSQQLTSFLRYIVNECLAGRSDRLKERTVAVCALGRGTDFDARLDCVVRVVAGKLRRNLERYYLLQGTAAAVAIEVPKGSYCPVFRRRANGAPCMAHATSESGQSTDFAQPTSPVIAVVPFKSLTRGAKERVWADMLADGVIMRLSRFPGLHVVDCLARRWGPKLDDLCGTAMRLHAHYVFGGTISRLCSNIRLTLRLIDGHAGVLEWGDQFDRRLEHSALVQQQDDLADHIVLRIVDFLGLA
jgi:TolB-like protein